MPKAAVAVASLVLFLGGPVDSASAAGDVALDVEAEVTSSSLFSMAFLSLFRVLAAEEEAGELLLLLLAPLLASVSVRGDIVLATTFGFFVL